MARLDLSSSLAPSWAYTMEATISTDPFSIFNDFLTPWLAV